MKMRLCSKDKIQIYFLITVKIQISALGAYFIFEFFTWALIQSGRLLNAGRLIIFLTLCNETNQKQSNYDFILLSQNKQIKSLK